MADTNTTSNSGQSTEQPIPASASQQFSQGAASPAGQVPPQQPQQPQQGWQGTVPPAGQVPPQQGQVPPMGQTPPQQPYGFAPSAQAAPAPQNLPGMPLLYLSGGMKFGWAAVGFFMGLVGILIAWLTNAHNFPQARSEAVRFALIGFVVSFVLVILLLVLFGFTACAALNASLSGYYYYY